jgi:hypothetical protein
MDFEVHRALVQDELHVALLLPVAYFLVKQFPDFFDLDVWRRCTVMGLKRMPPIGWSTVLCVEVTANESWVVA